MTAFHLHLVSDATGETLVAVAKAALAQFESAEPVTHLWTMIRNRDQLEETLAVIAEKPGLVVFTLVDHTLREHLQRRCRQLQLPSVPVLDPVISAVGSYLGAKSREQPGLQHVMYAEYFGRIDAMQFCMSHDDGQGSDNLDEADVVLVGVSRTSKTPTCVYLANRGIKAANIPIVPDVPLPGTLEQLEDTLVVGLVASPDRLVQIRRNRLLALSEDRETDYVDLARVREEVIHAKRLFSRQQWPVIDVTRRSIEETAAAILNLYGKRTDPLEPG
jgi:regulator of PEP synthase PpsR (kinase-PPPase family)